jgi:putative ABC transport system substrate-binding protein
VAVLVNPVSTAQNEFTLRELEPAARATRVQIQILNAGTRQEIDAAFEVIARERPDALLVTPDTFFTSRRVQLVNLATRYAIPTAFPNREFAEIGALMSYGTSISNAWRQSGSYAARILKGAKPADLPVLQSTEFDLVINAQTARMLGLTVPDKLLVAADEVID